MGRASVCAMCGEEAKFSCGACRITSYCNKQHQRMHWETHKHSCSPFKIVDDSVVGRRLVARRNMRRGEVVLHEYPLVTGPMAETPPVCLGCYNAIDPSQPGFMTCPDCGWPLCSSECRLSPNHKPECQWAVTKRKDKVKITQFGIGNHLVYSCIMPLRVLFTKTARPQVWEKLISLESHEKERKGLEKWKLEKSTIVPLIKKFYNLADEFSEEDILRICGIIQINSHEVNLSEPNHLAMFWEGSLLEHSCRPNCSKSFTTEGELVIRAVEDVARGEAFSICYTDPMWATPLRRHHLLTTKYFECNCTRCADPSEMGTYFSAISCTIADGCKGKMIPNSFLKEEGTWRCCICSGDAALTVVSSVLKQAKIHHDKTNKEDVSCLVKFLEDRSIPETHQYKVEAMLALAQLYGQKGGLAQLSDEELRTKEVLLRQLVRFTTTLLLGECRLRGVLLFELHSTLAERASRLSRLQEQLAARHTLTEAKKCLEEVIELLRFEPDGHPEHDVYTQACDNRRQLESVLVQTHMDDL